MLKRQRWYKMNLGITATQYIEQIKNGSLTVEEFTAKTIERIKKVEGSLHAYISLNDNAISQAKQIDKKLKAKEKVGICLGMPISIKDNLCTKGMKTTCASKILENFVAPYDATVVSNLKSQDAIITGKTNLDEIGRASCRERV